MLKVLKFGGTSVGSVAAIRSLQRIVLQQTADCVVVVSALSGITDQLIAVGQAALSDGDDYLTRWQQICLRHRQMCDELGLTDTLWPTLETMLDDLQHVLYGVHLVHELSPRSAALIVSYGERMSSRIVAALVGAEHRDSLRMIHTHHVDGRQVVDQERTTQAVQQMLAGHQPHLVVCGGFISTDSDTLEVTNLGRGGSDYTASLIADALHADQLEIWTDVNGFMTADPRVVSKAYTIDRLSYAEAAELCNCGAKVVYPPTIYPAYRSHIPIRILNTMAPDEAGTLITDQTDSHRAIQGISSINQAALVTVAGLSMVGVVGVSKRIFQALSEHGISEFFVSQTSSESSISIGVYQRDAELAKQVLDQAFQLEIAVGSMYPARIDTGLATVAIVGEHMHDDWSIAGRLYTTLSRNGIEVLASARSASQTSISVVVRQEMLIKALNVLHDSFFLSDTKVVNVFVCGIGTVGGKLLEQIREQADTLRQEHHLALRVVGIANSRAILTDPNGLDLTNYRDQLMQHGTPCQGRQLAEHIIRQNLYNSVFVDCTASAEVAELYQTLVEHNISVVTANKIAASGDYQAYRRLKQTALQRGVKFLYETNVGAGLPIIGTIADLVASGDRIIKIQAVLSGTLNFIFNRISATTPLSEAIRQSMEAGYAEPDPRIDLSGKDVIRKLVILAREAGMQVEQSDVEKHLFLPDHLFQGSLDQFWEEVRSLDADWEKRRQQLEEAGHRWRFVATMEGGQTRVELLEVDAQSPFYHLEGSNNIVLLTTERYRDYPMMIQGYGAGAAVTAAGVFANIMAIASI